ncbi:MAG: hypothetical protein IPJ66_16050 [Bacteroidetes bacterium]|nr:hypothetical protein [Bacteroidota bacterium]
MTKNPPTQCILTLKGGAPVTKNLHHGAGILFADVPSSFASDNVDYDHFGIGFGLVTYGNTDHNLTIGFGKVLKMERPRRDRCLPLAG